MKKLVKQRAELMAFTLVTIITTYPFLSLHFFPTLDGASHMSNASIIRQIVLYNNEIVRQFFIINPEPVPNWITHFILAVTGVAMPAFLSEKILLVMLLAGTPFAFRSLIGTVAPGHPFLSLLVFPFVHSMFFYFGFYNFCFAVMFFLITVNFWLRHVNQINSIRNILSLATLIMITYFSHVLVFGVLLAVIALHILSISLNDWLIRKTMRKKVIQEFFGKILPLTLASLIPLLLFFYFLFVRHAPGNVIYLPFKTLTANLVNMQPLIVFDGVKEGNLTRLFFLFLGVLTGTALVTRSIYLYKRKKGAPSPGQEEIDKNRTINSIWLTLSLNGVMILYFILPDALGDASYTTYRLGYIAFLLLVAWISTSRIPYWLQLAAAIFTLYISFTLINLRQPKISELEKIAIACNKAAEFVAPNSIVLPIYCMDNWFIGHFVDYLAVDKPMIMLYNYECETGFFPVKYNLKEKPNYYLGNPSIPSRLIRFQRVKGKAFRRINYVFMAGACNPDNTDNWVKISHILATEFTIIYKSDYCILYQKNG